MIQSMTGMTGSEKSFENFTVRIDLKSYNHRFLDIKLRLPSELLALEEDLKTLLKKYVKRGRVEGSVKIISDLERPGFEIDNNIMKQFKELCDVFESEFERQLQISPESLLKYPGLITAEESTDFLTDCKENFLQFFEENCTKLAEMRIREGEMLTEILKDLMVKSEECLEKINQKKDLSLEAYKVRLKKNLESLELSMDENDPAILREIGFAVNRADINEEIDRFRSHVRHFYKIMNEFGEPIGKKLDFLCQEMNREVNTICSKSESSEITKIGIDLKSQIESFREQIQNIQ